jgi:predicted nucleic acid-binding protein
MSATRFFDTNILLYAYDIDAPAKREIALRLLEQAWNGPGEAAISVQVLQELHVNLVRRGISPADAGQILRDFAPWPIVENTYDLLLSAVTAQARWQLSFWDSLILAAARASGAVELVTEDFSHGQDYGGIRARNPFR